MLPQFEQEETSPPVVTAAQRLEQRKKCARLPSVTPPKTVIFCFHSPFVKKILQTLSYTVCDGSFSKLYFLTDYKGVALSDFGGGASLTASKMEELIAWGVEQFISIGTAGTLSPKAPIGTLIVCEKAVRDEITSKHYLPSAKYIHSPRRMTNKLQQALKKADCPYLIGSTWTTDRLCEPKEADVQHYKCEGVLALDRETAALFAVAHFYQVDLGALLTISNSHADILWDPDSEDELVNQGLQNLFKAASEAALD